MTPGDQERAALVAKAERIIHRGSGSFRSASRLFDLKVRERAWLLYAWCRACDDITDGQSLGHDAQTPDNPEERQRIIERLTEQALSGVETGEPAFDALGLVQRECAIPTRFIHDHIAGFALDAGHWTPATEDDLLRYCYHVAGSVGAMMTVVMGVDPHDRDTLNRASDLGIAFQLDNIARDIIPDALAGRVYIPSDWLSSLDLSPSNTSAIAAPSSRAAIAIIAERMVRRARDYRRSARVGAARLPYRSRLAVLAAANIYGAIGEKVVRRGPRAWNDRTVVRKPEKALHFARALVQSLLAPKDLSRSGLWTAPF